MTTPFNLKNPEHLRHVLTHWMTLLHHAVRRPDYDPAFLIAPFPQLFGEARDAIVLATYEDNKVAAINIQSSEDPLWGHTPDSYAVRQQEILALLHHDEAGGSEEILAFLERVTQPDPLEGNEGLIGVFTESSNKDVSLYRVEDYRVPERFKVMAAANSHEAARLFKAEHNVPSVTVRGKGDAGQGTPLRRCVTTRCDRCNEPILNDANVELDATVDVCNVCMGGEVKEVSDLLGKTMANVEQIGKEEIVFTLTNGKRYRLYHEQDCCESVYIEDVCGELDDLIGSPLTMAEESISHTNPEGFVDEYQDSFTWTFYRFATVKGYVTIRFYGSSNGYYSETANFGEKVY